MREGSKHGKLKKGVLVSALVMSSLLWSGQAFAGEQEEEAFALDQVLVTATRTLEEARKVPANVTIITAEEIKAKNVTTITDLFKNTVGIFVNRPKGLAETANGIVMRGFSEDNILVLYDGMPMNTAYDGGVNWNAIPVDNIERIEIVRGAASSLYGGRAVAGVINIITKTPDKAQVRVSSVYGSNNTWRKSVSLSQKASDKFSYYFSYENRSTDGFPNKIVSTTSGSATPTGTVGYGVVTSQTVAGAPRYIIGTPGDGAGESDTYNVKLKYNLAEHKNVVYSYTHDKFRYFTENPVSYIRDINGNILYNGSVQLPDGKWYNFTASSFGDYYGRRTTDVHALKYEDTANKVIFNIGVSDVKDSGYSTVSSGTSLDGSRPGSDTSYPSKSYKLDFQKTWDQVDRHTIVGGFSWQHDKMTRTSASLTHWQDPDSITGITSQAGGADQNLSLFVQDEYDLTAKWKMYSGLRLDHYKKYDGYYKVTGNNIRYEEASYNELSPKIAFEYLQDDKTTYYTSYGHSFNAPSLYQLYRTDSTFTGNPALKPETSNTLEVGIKKRLGTKTSYNLSLFQAKTDNLIIDETSPDPAKKWYNNLTKAKRTGWEFDLKHQFDKQWGGYINYAWQRGEDGQGNRISSIPKDIFHAGVTYNKDKWAANLDAEYVSERNKPGQVSGVYLSYDGFFITNFGMSYKLKQDTAITFNINNLFDKNYYLWYAAAGRTYSVGVQFDL